MSDETLRDFAKKQLKKKQDFKVYLWVYAFVVGLTTAVWYLTSPSAPYWPAWVILGMGIAAFFVGLDAYGKLGSKPITDADIDAEVERLKRKG
jgi:hypothetical protein